MKPSSGAAGFNTNDDLERIIAADTLPGVPYISETTNGRTRAQRHIGRYRQATSSNINAMRQQSIPTVSSTIDRPNNVYNNRQRQEEADHLLALQMSTNSYVNYSGQQPNIDRRLQGERERRQQQERDRRQQQERDRSQQQERDRIQQEIDIIQQQRRIERNRRHQEEIDRIQQQQQQQEIDIIQQQQDEIYRIEHERGNHLNVGTCGFISK
ncbi:bromodomain-containing protein DDB_G0280777-like [Ruditapes philippinarum]|uniref:bromodomain-containing protein DDB_G0280777-like n=1 Tax=Ruditapes philippinarum TaxID=129788 RepID=UPI00295BCBB0|nr:bromodomain-containing protein DDB_G0280777-like [Ruditapes philippinarum]